MTGLSSTYLGSSSSTLLLECALVLMDCDSALHLSLLLSVDWLSYYPVILVLLTLLLTAQRDTSLRRRGLPELVGHAYHTSDTQYDNPGGVGSWFRVTIRRFEGL